MPSDASPLILTATLDAATQAWLDGLRRAHFPAARNHLSAHLTLFHHLTEDPVPALRALLPAAPLAATVGPPYSLGRGVAYRVDCAELVAFRRALAGRLVDLTPQDRGWNRPHVTVQNKVAPDAARALLAQLDPAPRPCTITGVALWRYLGGPWAPEADFSFGPPPAGRRPRR